MKAVRAAVAPAQPRRDPSPTPPDAVRFELERNLMDADRMMMQAVSLSLSLIGFGFSLNAFFNEVATKGVVAHADRAARQLGLALLLIGLLFLSLTIVTQARYRRRLMAIHDASRDHDLHILFGGRATPTFVTAFLLLSVGVASAVWILVSGFF